MKYAALILSDWHMGLQQYLPVAYDPDILEKRVRSIPGMLPKKIEHLYVLFVGDMAEGCDVFPAQNGQIRISAREQTSRLVPIGNNLIRHLIKKYGSVKAYGVKGNHGRTSKTSPPDNNWDLQLYSQINGMECPVYTHDVRTIHIGKTKVVIQHRAEVDDSTAKETRMVHKDLYLATTSMARKIQRRLDFYAADLLVGAHWHQGHAYAFGGKIRYIINGALCGPTTHSEFLGFFTGPRQALVEFDDVGVVGVSWLEW